LSGCERNTFSPQSIIDVYSKARKISAQAEIATVSGVLMTYSISYESTPDSTIVTILEPDSLAGVSARLKEDGATLVFDGVEAETLLPAVAGFVPVDALEHTLQDLEQKVPSEYCFETYHDTDAIAVTYSEQIGGYQTEKRVWLQKGDLAVLGAEYYLDGRQVMTLRNTVFQIYE
jgi:hypothetical protein